MLRDVFGFRHVDAGGGWLIFAMPPAELGVHPAEGPNFESGTGHLLSFMCDNIAATIADLRMKGVTVTDGPKDEGYGITAMLRLPGNCNVMIYEPRHTIAAGLGTPASTHGAPASTHRAPAFRRGKKQQGKKKVATPRPRRRATTAARRR